MALPLSTLIESNLATVGIWGIEHERPQGGGYETPIFPDGTSVMLDVLVEPGGITPVLL